MRCKLNEFVARGSNSLQSRADIADNSNEDAWNGSQARPTLISADRARLPIFSFAEQPPAGYPVFLARPTAHASKKTAVISRVSCS
jgi:hypothetical protein